MFLSKVLFILPPPGVVSPIHEGGVLIFTWMGLSGNYGLVENEWIVWCDVPFSQKRSIMINDRLIRISLVTLK